MTDTGPRCGGDEHTVPTFTARSTTATPWARARVGCAKAREGEPIVPTSPGRSSGFCIDPIEKKPLHHFPPGAPVPSFGTAGCRPGRRCCQSWGLPESGETSAVAPETTAAEAERRGRRSTAAAYNDPTILLEDAAGRVEAVGEPGLKAIAVAAGYVDPAPRAERYAHMDAADIDLKAFAEGFYERIAFASPATVPDTLRYPVHETDVWTEITALLIPGGRNDSDATITAECERIAELLGPDVPLHRTALHPDFEMSDVPPTPPARAIAVGAGLRYVRTESACDPAGRTTYCPGCGETLVARDRYRIGRYALSDSGQCVFYGVKLSGVHEGQAGDLGPRRQPIRFVTPS